MRPESARANGWSSKLFGQLAERGEVIGASDEQKAGVGVGHAREGADQVADIGSDPEVSGVPQIEADAQGHCPL